jgi:hypothetical protein
MNMLWLDEEKHIVNGEHADKMALLIDDHKAEDSFFFFQTCGVKHSDRFGNAVIGPERVKPGTHDVAGKHRNDRSSITSQGKRGTRQGCGFGSTAQSTCHNAGRSGIRRFALSLFSEIITSLTNQRRRYFKIFEEAPVIP